MLALGIWLGIVLGASTPWMPISDPLAWHRHEMLFGFVGATIAGFALTAVPNWTGRLPIAGPPLAALFVAWLLGRLLPFVVSPGSWVAICADGAFYLLLAGLLGREVLISRNRNLPIVSIIGLFGIAAMVDSCQSAGLIAGSTGWRGAFVLVIMLISIIGGRIIPSFTRNWLAASKAPEPLPTQPTQFDKLVLALTALALAIWLVVPESAPAAAISAICALLQTLRLKRWQGWRTLRNPLLSILHVGYAWLPIGFSLLALAQAGAVPETAAIHAFSAGAMATLILAVMSRASLGHTGRALVAGRMMTISFILLTAAACARVWAGLGGGDQQATLAYAGIGWFGAFSLFLLRYGPILCAARFDNAKARER